MSRNWVESIVGAVVLAVAAWFLIYSYQVGAGAATGGGYGLVAKFTSANGVAVGSDVRISGIAVGKVADVTLDPITYLAELHIAMNAEAKVPADSSIAIKSESLLGGRFLAIEPGAEEDMLADGGEIKFTQPAVSLEDLIGQLIFSNQPGAN